MRTFVHLLPLGLLALGVHGRQFSIPQVDQAVDQALSDFDSYMVHAVQPAVETVKQIQPASLSRLSKRIAIPDPAYWLANSNHTGKSAFNSDTSYKVWRNVKDFGAKGDGVTDDTAAINAAISSGNRCVPGQCQSTTTTPALVYFPAGIYLVSQPIVQYYFTQLHGNPNRRATIKATAGFSGAWVIDGDPYLAGGVQSYGSTNVFYRQIRNLVVDMTAVPVGASIAAIHWPTSQATSLQNVQINLSQASGTQHIGLFIENGSAGFISDITVVGGLVGINIGNQQYTIRNVTVSNAVTAINQLWSWGFTYKSLTINNCTTGIDMTAVNTTTQAQLVGAVIILDSSISNTPVFAKTARNTNPNPPAAGSLVLENIALSNVPVAVQGKNGATLLNGGSTTIAGWQQGRAYGPNGASSVSGTYTPAARPSSLVSGNKFYEVSKPQYESVPVASVISVRAAGAVGDGRTDDTQAVQSAINQGASSGKLVFFDAGTYKVSSTITIPARSRIVGESYSVIMSAGSFFANANSPQPVVKIGNSGDVGSVQWSDMVVSTQGSQAGAILIQWNLKASPGSGMWDVHTRIGGFAGSNLQVANCPTSAAPSAACYAAYGSMQVTSVASGVYLENVWLWTADHDLDDATSTQISVYTGRGLSFESTTGTAWLYGTCIEHHEIYQYNFYNTKNVFLGHATIETPYYQPSPDVNNGPYKAGAAASDPNYSKICTQGGNCDALGLRIANSSSILTYGTGLYSFFNKYSTKCSDAGGPENCQSVIFDIENSTGITSFVVNTVGTTCMVYRDGVCLARYADYVSVYPDTIVQFRTG